MKNTLSFPLNLFIIAISVLFFSCTDKSTHEEITPNLAITAAIDQQTGSTKTVRTTDFQKNDIIGIYMVPFQNATTQNELRTSGNYRDNIAYTHNGTEFALTGSKNAQYPNNVLPVSLYAISPYSTSDDLKSLTAYSFTIKADQSTDANIYASDLLTASLANKKPESTAATLTFKHRLSKVRILITTPTIYKGLTVTGIKDVKINSTKPTALINLFPATPNDDTDVTVDTKSEITEIIAQADTPDANPHGYEAIAVPQSIANLQINFSLVTTGDVIHKLTYTHPSTFTLKSSKSHIITLAIEDEKVFAVGTPTITAWGSTTLSPGDTPEMAANETFNLSANAGLTGVSKAKIYCALETYSVSANYTAETGATVFKFNGLQNQSPGSYPYTINKIELQNTSDVVLQTITVTQLVHTRTPTTINITIP